MGVNAGARGWGRRGDGSGLAHGHLRQSLSGDRKWGRHGKRRSEVETFAWTHTHTHTGQKRYRISRKGPTKSCQVAFRLTFRVTASAAREHSTTSSNTPDTLPAWKERKGARRGEDFFLSLFPFSFQLYFYFSGWFLYGSRCIGGGGRRGWGMMEYRS